MNDAALDLMAAIVGQNVRDLAWTNEQIRKSDEAQYQALVRAFVWLYATAESAGGAWVNRDLERVLDALAWRYEDAIQSLKAEAS